MLERRGSYRTREATHHCLPHPPHPPYVPARLLRALPPPRSNLLLCRPRPLHKPFIAPNQTAADASGWTLNKTRAARVNQLPSATFLPFLFFLFPHPPSSLSRAFLSLFPVTVTGAVVHRVTRELHDDAHLPRLLITLAIDKNKERNPEIVPCAFAIPSPSYFARMVALINA